MEPENFFSDGHYLLGDSAYKLSLQMLTPYKNPAATIPENARFNYQFSQARVKIEHVMGLLKSRWSNLRGIRIQINKQNDLVRINRWIKCTFILHNITTNTGDVWNNIDAVDDGSEDVGNGPYNVPRTAHQFREDLKRKLNS